MARETVECKIEEGQIEEDGRTGLGVTATCTNCNTQTQSFGTGEKSRKRCLVLMKEECPYEDNNFYVEEGA